jgi:REP element-mobilizing transposase RayT
MARQSREFGETGIQHIVQKGHDGKAIFANQEDVDTFLNILIELQKMYKFRVFAYCFMSNHVHLVMRFVDPRIVSGVMKRLKLRYSNWYHRHYGCTGTIYQGRYYSRAIDNEPYIVNAIRYVHLNPVKAKLCKTPIEYSNSSYQFYFGDNAWIIDREFVFQYMNKVFFEEYHKEDCGESVTNKYGMFLRFNENFVKPIPDREAKKLMISLSKCADGEAFQQLGRDNRWRLIKKFRQKGCSCSQIAEFIVKSRGAVYYWCRQTAIKAAS